MHHPDRERSAFAFSQVARLDPSAFYLGVRRRVGRSYEDGLKGICGLGFAAARSSLFTVVPTVTKFLKLHRQAHLADTKSKSFRKYLTLPVVHVSSMPDANEREDSTIAGRGNAAICFSDPTYSPTLSHFTHAAKNVALLLVVRVVDFVPRRPQSSFTCLPQSLIWPCQLKHGVCIAHAHAKVRYHP